MAIKLEQLLEVIGQMEKASIRTHTDFNTAEIADKRETSGRCPAKRATQAVCQQLHGIVKA